MIFVLVTGFIFFPIYSNAKYLRIVGGKDGDRDVYHVVVRMELKMENPERFHPFCTGSAVKPTWVLTAAHCIDGLEAMITTTKESTGVIRYGSALGNPWDKASHGDVLDRVKHPSYYNDNGRVCYHDIGLVKTTTINLNNFAKLSALDYKILVGLKAVVAGYGSTSFDKGSHTLALNKSLQVYDVIINKCPERMSTTIPYVMCLYGSCSSKGIIAPGDSGGPVMHSSGVIAVSSMGYGKQYKRKVFTTGGSAGVVFSISPYIPWIQSVVNNGF